MYNVRGTELQDFLRCRLAWKYRWIDGLQPKKPNVKLAFGTAMHKFLEEFYGKYDMIYYYEAKDLARFMLNEEIRDELDWQDQDELISQVIDGYVRQYAEHDINNWEVIATEFTFAIPLDDEIGYTGTIDLIVRDKSDGRIYFLDHKTTNSIEKYDKNSDMDRQISRYWWALQQLFSGKGQYSYDKEQWYDAKNFQLALDNTEIGGFIYNIILKDYPVPPKILKNGSLSKDKSQKTTYDMYMKALQEIGMEPPQDPHHEGWHIIPKDHEYHDMLVHLTESPKEFFRRIRVTRTQSEIDASISELRWTSVDMRRVINALKPPAITGLAYRNVTKDCPWCPFQPICAASMDGSNVDFLVESLYTKSE